MLLLRRITAAALTLVAAASLSAPTASAQYTCTQNTALASAFTVGNVVTCQATDQASLDACVAAVNSAPAATIIKIAPGTYTLAYTPYNKDVCFEV